MMIFVWLLAQTPKYREACENLVFFHMFFLGDWKEVVHRGPCIFRGFGLIIEDYDGRVSPTLINPDGFYV